MKPTVLKKIKEIKGIKEIKVIILLHISKNIHLQCMKKVLIFKTFFCNLYGSNFDL